MISDFWATFSPTHLCTHILFFSCIKGYFRQAISDFGKPTYLLQNLISFVVAPNLGLNGRSKIMRLSGLSQGTLCKRPELGVGVCTNVGLVRIQQWHQTKQPKCGKRLSVRCLRYPSCVFQLSCLLHHIGVGGTYFCPIGCRPNLLQKIQEVWIITTIDR